jgi:hypothetical protein
MALLLVIYIAPDELATVCPGENAFPIHFVLEPFSDIAAFVVPAVAAVA